MKITDKTLKTGMIPVSAIVDGTIFRGSIGRHESIFLKAYNTVIDLYAPSSTWTVESTNGDSIFVKHEELDAELIVKSKQKK